MKFKSLIFPFFLCCVLATDTRCARSSASQPEEFVGHWEAESGDFVTILPEGVGDLKHGLVSMHGAAVKIAGDQLEMDLWGREETFQINEGPEDHQEYWAMTLSGVEYKRIIAVE